MQRYRLVCAFGGRCRCRFWREITPMVRQLPPTPSGQATRPVYRCCSIDKLPRHDTQRRTRMPWAPDHICKHTRRAAKFLAWSAMPVVAVTNPHATCLPEAPQYVGAGVIIEMLPSIPPPTWMAARCAACHGATVQKVNMSFHLSEFIAVRQ